MTPGTAVLDAPETRTPAGPVGPPPKLRVPPAAHGVDICGVMIDIVSLEDMLLEIQARIAQGVPGYIITPNVDHVCLCQRNPEFRQAYQDAFLSVPDGMPLIWGGRFLGTPLVQRLSGNDIIYSISELAADKGYSVYFLGAAEGVAQEAARRLKELYPALHVAGTHSPPLKFERSAEENAETIERLRVAAPDICFVAVGSPKQEIWMRRHCGECRVPVMIGVGAALDFTSGHKRRAPVALQKMGLEWFWRLCMEPRRLWHRYLVEDMLFFKLLARQLVSRFTTRRRGPVAAGTADSAASTRGNYFPE
jgi:N-acetylglucosaminyldiphosphoundecaprenol N-acetyl-beta-D-mannosaminyltransferase